MSAMLLRKLRNGRCFRRGFIEKRRDRGYARFADTVILAQGGHSQTWCLQDRLGAKERRCTYPALVSTSGWITVLAIMLAVRKKAASTGVQLLGKDTAA